jgi:hypothetical protein
MKIPKAKAKALINPNVPKGLSGTTSNEPGASEDGSGWFSGN